MTLMDIKSKTNGNLELDIFNACLSTYLNLRLVMLPQQWYGEKMAFVALAF